MSMNSEVKLHYTTQDWRQCSSSLLEKTFPSVEVAKSGLPEGSKFAAIFEEDRYHYFTPRFGWDETARG